MLLSGTRGTTVTDMTLCNESVFPSTQTLVSVAALLPSATMNRDLILQARPMHLMTG